MKLALDEAKKSVYREGAFCVGAVIVSSTGEVLSTGYSRELPAGEEGELHAEHCALVKLKDTTLLKDASMYTTMEPCSVRTSGKRPCVSRIMEAQIKKVYVGVLEPSDFVVCEGTQELRSSGVEVIAVPGLEQECLNVARGRST